MGENRVVVWRRDGEDLQTTSGILFGQGGAQMILFDLLQRSVQSRATRLREMVEYPSADRVHRFLGDVKRGRVRWIGLEELLNRVEWCRVGERSQQQCCHSEVHGMWRLRGRSESGCLKSRR